MSAVPREYWAKLPPHILAEDVVAFGVFGRSPGHDMGESLLLRFEDQKHAILVREPEDTLFKEVQLALLGEPIRILNEPTGPRLVAEQVSGETFAISLIAAEVPVASGVLRTLDRAPKFGTARPEPLSMNPTTRSMGTDRPSSPSRGGPSPTLRPPTPGSEDVVVLGSKPKASPRQSAFPTNALDGSSNSPSGLGSEGPRDTVISPPRGSMRPSSATNIGSIQPAAGVGAIHQPRTKTGHPPNASPSSTSPEGVPTPEPKATQTESSKRPDLPAAPRAPFAFASERPPPSADQFDVHQLRKKLVELRATGNIDQAALTAEVLRHLGLATDAERLMAELVSKSLPSFAVPMQPSLIKAKVSHQDQDPWLSRFLIALWPTLHVIGSKSDRDLGLRPEDEIKPSLSAGGIARLFSHAARALGISCPRLFVREDTSGGLAFLPTQPPGSLCGKSLLTGFDVPSTLFVMAHHLSFYRPEAYFFALVPDLEEELDWASAALQLMGRIPFDSHLEQRVHELDRHMVPPVREALEDSIEALGDVPDFRLKLGDSLIRYRRGVWLDATRLGLIVCGSLDVAARIQRIMPRTHGLRLDDILSDLLDYASSERLSELRVALGFDVRQLP